MADNTSKNFFINKSCNHKNAEPKVEKKKVVDTLRERPSPKTQNPEREEIARAAAERLKEEEERKKARKEKAIREKEEAKRAEEEKIEAMKREAAEKTEAMERKEAIRAAVAKADAAAAAEERAAKAAAEERAAMPADHIHSTPGTPFKKEIQGRENVSVSKDAQLSKKCAKESADLVLHNKIKRHKEDIRKKEEEELAAKKQAAAEAAEALEIKEAVQAGEAQAAAAAAALARAAKAKQSSVNSFQNTAEALEIREAIKAGEAQTATALARATSAKQSSVNSFQNKVQEKEVIDAISGKHILTAGTENITADAFYDSIKEEKPLSSMISLINENQLREVRGEHKFNNQKGPQKFTGFYEESYYTTQSGARPKGKIDHEVNGQAGQNSGHPYKSSGIIASQENENDNNRQAKENVSGMGNQAIESPYSDGQKDIVSVMGSKPLQSQDRGGQKEIVSVMGSKALQSQNRGDQKEIVSMMGSKAPQSQNSGDQKEIVSVTGHDKSSVQDLEPLKYEGEKLDIHHSELDNRRKVKNSEVKENSQDHIQGYQNGFTSDNRDPKGPIHQGKQNRRNQQYYTPPVQRNEGFQHSNQQPYHREQQNYNHYHENGRERHHSSPSYKHQPHAQKTPHLPGPQRALMCVSCEEKFNLENKLPRNLYCGHSMCTHCIEVKTLRNKSVLCPLCATYTWHIERFEQCPVNQPLVNILSEESMQDYARKDQERRGPHLHEGSGSRQYKSQPGSNDMARSSLGQVGNKSLSPRSPHGSKCMDVGVRPSSYCCTCEVWVCARCAEAEHSTRRCSLRPLRDQLTVMKQRIDNEGKRAQELLGKSLQSLENTLNEDKVFLIWMRAAFECVEKKQECMKKELEEGRKSMNTLIDVMKSMPSATNLPEALATFQSMEYVFKAAQQWVSSADLSAADGDQETAACLRHLMRRTLRSYKVENGTSEMHAVDKLLGSELQSELRVDGGRFHLHALKKNRASSQGIRALPVECFKPCQAAASTLVFLDLSWGGANQGRLFIRLTGDTLRGRQFISLCIGEGGISFRGTCFHRVWWRGQPGEHVWTGDYENGDGSGGKSLISPSKHEEISAGREVPISAGLVAGRYEKENVSSIFRIYTRGVKEGKDEAGFGQVEFGLDLVKEAVKQRNIQDVTISDCGLVLEM